MTTINFRMSKNKSARVIESVLVVLFFCIQLLNTFKKMYNRENISWFGWFFLKLICILIKSKNQHILKSSS